MQFLTVQMLFKNSEEHIRRAIESLLPLREFIKEIVFVNNGSTDGSMDIIREYYDKFQMKLIMSEAKSFSTLRNMAIEMAEGTWTLVLDSDEVVSKNMYWELLQLTQQEGIYAWFFPRVLLYPDESNFLIDAYPDYQMRLFLNDKSIRFTRDVHEYLIRNVNGQEVSLGITQPNTKITHKLHFFHYQLLATKESLEAKGENWLERQKDSKQAGFDIVGKDAYVFKNYQHRTSPIAQSLKEELK